ncbi:MAG: flagellar hook assembly protein FlgD [Gammaproteobacteria bacterium]|nr:MAG: flagellar hook assembly protein FlgD [Gammaproteobacteria bacterium]
MTSISDVANIVNQGSTATKEEKKSNELGQEDFLKLMTTQLQNQDPFKPMDDGQFIAQMASFSTASGIGELQESFEDLASAINGNQLLQYSSLVDREVLINSDTGFYDGSNEMTASVNVPASSSSLSVNVYSQSGVIVDSLELGPQAAGEVSFAWDGTDHEGDQLPPGKYVIKAETNYGGTVTALDTNVMAKVESISMGVGGRPPTLNLQGLGSMSTSGIAQIR